MDLVDWLLSVRLPNQAIRILRSYAKANLAPKPGEHIHCRSCLHLVNRGFNRILITRASLPLSLQKVKRSRLDGLHSYPA